MYYSTVFLTSIISVYLLFFKTVDENVCKNIEEIIEIIFWNIKMIKFSVEVDTVLGLGLSGARSASGKLTLIYYKKKTGTLRSLKIYFLKSYALKYAFFNAL